MIKESDADNNKDSLYCENLCMYICSEGSQNQLAFHQYYLATCIRIEQLFNLIAYMKIYTCTFVQKGRKIIYFK